MLTRKRHPFLKCEPSRGYLHELAAVLLKFPPAFSYSGDHFRLTCRSQDDTIELYDDELLRLQLRQLQTQLVKRWIESGKVNASEYTSKMQDVLAPLQRTLLDIPPSLPPGLKQHTNGSSTGHNPGILIWVDLRCIFTAAKPHVSLDIKETWAHGAFKKSS
eukprot:776623-Amphidinium_carterae.1